MRRFSLSKISEMLATVGLITGVLGVAAPPSQANFAVDNLNLDVKFSCVRISPGMGLGLEPGWILYGENDANNRVAPFIRFDSIESSIEDSVNESRCVEVRNQFARVTALDQAYVMRHDLVIASRVQGSEIIDSIEPVICAVPVGSNVSCMNEVSIPLITLHSNYYLNESDRDDALATLTDQFRMLDPNSIVARRSSNFSLARPLFNPSDPYQP